MIGRNNTCTVFSNRMLKALSPRQTIYWYWHEKTLFLPLHSQLFLTTLVRFVCCQSWRGSFTVKQRITGRGGAKLEGRRVQVAVKNCWRPTRTIQMKRATPKTAQTTLLWTGTIKHWSELRGEQKYQHRTVHQLFCQQWKCNLLDNSFLKSNMFTTLKQQYVTISCKQVSICRVDGGTHHLDLKLRVRKPIPAVKWCHMEMQCALKAQTKTSLPSAQTCKSDRWQTAQTRNKRDTCFSWRNIMCHNVKKQLKWHVTEGWTMKWD